MQATRDASDGALLDATLARARVLQERLELPFPRYVRGLRAKNRFNYRHLVLHGDAD